MGKTNRLPEQPANYLLRDIILDAILLSIDRTGNKIQASKELGITKATLVRYIKAGFSDGRKFTIEQIGRLSYKVKR